LVTEEWPPISGNEIKTLNRQLLEKEPIKKILALAASLPGMTAIYKPNSIVPKYYIDKTPQSEYRLYGSKQNVVQKYIVKPNPWGNGYRVYETG
jgi:hypothetical protein